MRAMHLASVFVIAACVARPATDTSVRVEPQRPAMPANKATPPANVHCPPAVFEQMRTVDLTDSENSILFSPLADESIECQVEALRIIAARLDGASDERVIGDFCETSATLSRFLSPAARDEVRAAYLRFPYSESIHLGYFLGLRTNRIDLRTHLAGKIAEDWTFTHPRQNAETWHFKMYLASLDEPGAYKELADKIAATGNGNDATNLLKSLAELRTEPVRQILERYANDARRADGSDGPGMTIAQTVALLLQQFPPRP